MKIYSVGVQTAIGWRVVKLSVPIDVEPNGDTSPQVRSLADLLWGIVREVSGQRPEAPKAKA